MSGPLTGLHRTAQQEQWRWRECKYQSFPPGVQDAVLAEIHRLDADDYREANIRTEQVCSDLKASQVGKAFDDARIRDHAENYARLCSRMPTLDARAVFAAHVGVAAPTGKHVTGEGAAKRLDDPQWWRRQLRRVWTRNAENSMRDLGLVRRNREPYASDAAVIHRAAMKRRAREFVERSVLVNEVGEQLELVAVAERSQANPALRRGEFMCRMRGFEEIANDMGHVAEFCTLTAPSIFHAYLSTGLRNPSYRRAVVREAQQWLCKMWARARAKLKRLSVLVYGCRIAEPHHDATPHWHCLLFVPANQADTLRDVLRGVWLAEFAQEPGARAHRVKFERVDPGRGSAVGYVAKYVSKNIDGAGVISTEQDRETETPVAEGIARVDAWASLHGIRQFAVIGGPPVGLWREARRLRDEVGDRDIERTRRCADSGDWRAFVVCVGGILAGRKTNLRIERHETGEINKYGECRAARVVGLRWASAVAISRPHRWRIECRATPIEARGSDISRVLSGSEILSPLGPVAITVRITDSEIDLTGLPNTDARASDRDWLRRIWQSTS